METYPQYRFEDFYRKHFYQGGLTLPQVQILYKTSVRRKNDEYIFLAGIHGIDISKDVRQESQSSAGEQAPKEMTLFTFGDPKEYEHLTPEQRQELTEKMMLQHQQWSGQVLKGKKNG